MLLMLYTLYRMQVSAWPGKGNHSSPPAPGGNEQYSVYRGQDIGPKVLSERQRSDCSIWGQRGKEASSVGVFQPTNFWLRGCGGSRDMV